MQLERELATYREKLPDLVRHEGEYVLIHGDIIAGTFVSYQDALRQGYRQFGLKPFLVKQILSTERVHYVTRFIEPITG